MTKEQIIARFKEERIKRGFSQEQIAKIIGIARASVTQMENGQRDISATEYIALTKSLGIDWDFIPKSEQQPLYIAQCSATIQISPDDWAVVHPVLTLTEQTTVKEIIEWGIKEGCSKGPFTLIRCSNH